MVLLALASHDVIILIGMDDDFSRFLCDLRIELFKINFNIWVPHFIKKVFTFLKNKCALTQHKT